MPSLKKCKAPIFGRWKNRSAPKLVSKAPVKEVILTGDQIDLYKLPQILHHQEDAGAYITAAISFAKDPNSRHLELRL